MIRLQQAQEQLNVSHITAEFSDTRVTIDDL
jgi:hypothetical protein